VKCHFHYEARDEPIMIPENKFETEYFNRLLDTVFKSIKERFKQ
jgi:hypothetical protein